jgi:hypothetical protein
VQVQDHRGLRAGYSQTDMQGQVRASGINRITGILPAALARSFISIFGPTLGIYRRQRAALSLHNLAHHSLLASSEAILR